LARVGALMRKNSFTYVEGFVGAAIESIAWASPTYDSRKAITSSRRRPPLNQQNLDFQTYATKHGQPESAKEAARNYGANSALRAMISARPTTGIYEIPVWVLIFISLLWTTGVLLLLLLPIAVFSAVLMTILGRVPRVRGVLRVCETSAEEIPSSREVGNGALACGGLRALMTALFAALVGGLCFVSIMIGVGESTQVFKAVSDFWNGITQHFGSDDGNYFSLIYGSIHELSWETRFAAALSPLLFGILFAAWRATEWQKTRNGESSFRWSVLARSLFGGRVFQSPTGGRDDFDLGGALRKLADWFLMLLLIAAWATLASMENTGGSHFMWLIPFALACLFGGILLGEKIALWRARSHRLQALRYGLRLWERSLWTWLVLGSALYFASLLISLPVRQNIERRVDRVLRLGEVGATLPAER